MGSQEPIPQQGAEGATAHQGVHQGVGGGVRGGGLSRAHPARPPANGRPEHGPRRYPRARGDEADGPQDAFGISEIQHRQRRRSGERGTDARRYRRRGHPGDSLTCARPQRPLHLTTWPMLLDRRVCRRIALCARRGHPTHAKPDSRNGHLVLLHLLQARLESSHQDADHGYTPPQR